MRKAYPLGEDLFMIIAFIAFIVGVALKLLNIETVIWDVTPSHLFKGAVGCLLFSVAMSLRDITRLAEEKQ